MNYKTANYFTVFNDGRLLHCKLQLIGINFFVIEFESCTAKSPFVLIYHLVTSDALCGVTRPWLTVFLSSSSFLSSFSFSSFSSSYHNWI